MALAHHNAPHGNQRRGANPIFIRTEHRRHDNITASFPATIGPQNDFAPQIIHRQHLMHLRKAHFPRQARMFD